jgi:hypothetical protein
MKGPSRGSNTTKSDGCNMITSVHNDWSPKRKLSLWFGLAVQDRTYNHCTRNETTTNVLGELGKSKLRRKLECIKELALRNTPNVFWQAQSIKLCDDFPFCRLFPAGLGCLCVCAGFVNGGLNLIDYFEDEHRTECIAEQRTSPNKAHTYPSLPACNLMKSTSKAEGL